MSCPLRGFIRTRTRTTGGDVVCTGTRRRGLASAETRRDVLMTGGPREIGRRVAIVVGRVAGRSRREQSVDECRIAVLCSRVQRRVPAALCPVHICAGV